MRDPDRTLCLNARDGEHDTSERTGCRNKRKYCLLVAALWLGLSAACSSNNVRTVKTERTQYLSEEPVRPVVVETETTETTETEESDGSGGIISGTVDVAGEILALPFRAAGGLIRLGF